MRECRCKTPDQLSRNRTKQLIIDASWHDALADIRYVTHLNKSGEDPMIPTLHTNTHLPNTPKSVFIFQTGINSHSCLNLECKPGIQSERSRCCLLEPVVSGNEEFHAFRSFIRAFGWTSLQPTCESHTTHYSTEHLSRTLHLFPSLQLVTSISPPEHPVLSNITITWSIRLLTSSP